MVSNRTRINATASLGTTHPRRCRLAVPGAEQTICGRPVTTPANVTTTDPRAMNCPDCWAAMTFVSGY